MANEGLSTTRVADIEDYWGPWTQDILSEAVAEDQYHVSYCSGR